MLPFSGNPSQEEINLHMVICMYNFAMCMVDIQITFLVNVPFQNSLKTSVNLLIAWWFQEIFQFPDDFMDY